MSDDRDPIRTGPNAKLLEEIRTRFDYARDEWADIRSEAQEDMRYVGGDPWDPKDRALREKNGRPCITLDELSQHFNQVINGVRANKRAIKFSPTGRGASEKSAAWYADKTREIEYRSHAQLAYTTAFQDAVHRGYGFIRLTTKFVSEFSFKRDQELWIEPMPNPDLSLPDPDAKRPDSSDAKFWFVEEELTHDEFQIAYPKAKLVDFTPLMRTYPRWFSSKKVTTAEYWTVTKADRLLLLMAPLGGLEPIEVFEDELEQMPPGAQKIDEKVVSYPRVRQYITNGVEILAQRDWPGKRIPIISCYGMVLYVGGTRRLLSMTRLARDPYMLYCWVRAKQAEIAKMTALAPVQGYEGQFRGHETDWQEASDIPKAFLEFRGLTEATGQQVLPPPSRIEYNAGEHLAGFEMFAEASRRAIQSAMGSSPLPTQAQRRNEKSGVALQQIEDTAQRGSYHFNDHYDDMIRCLGIQIEDVMDKVYDQARSVGTIQPNDNAQLTRINDPADPKAISTRGDHQVTVSTGPSFDSEREADKALAETLMASPFAPQIADLVIKLGGGGPIRDEIAERLTPPQFAKRPDGEQPSPGELQAQAQLQQMQQVMQEMGQKLQLDTVKTESAEKIKAAELQMRAQEAEAKNALEREKMRLEFQQQVELQKMKDATALQTAYIAANKQAESEAQRAEYEAIALEREQRHEAYQAERDRQHDEQMARVNQTHEAVLAQSKATKTRKVTKDENGRIVGMTEETSA